MGVSCGNDAESPSKGADFISGTPGMVCFLTLHDLFGGSLCIHVAQTTLENTEWP